MHSIKQNFLLLAALLIFASNLYSQVERMDDPFRDLNKMVLPGSKGELIDKVLENKNSSYLTQSKPEIKVTSVVDHAIAIDYDGTKKKYTYTYNSNNKKISEVIERWDGSNWGDYKRYTYTYDASGNLASYFDEYWRETYTYDADGNRTSLLRERWDSNSNQWANDLRETSTFDGNGNQTFWLQDVWMDNQWSSGLRNTFTYDTNGNMTSVLWEQVYADGRWYKTYRYTYTYDTNGNRTLEFRETWHINSQKWQNLNQWTNTYDANGNRISRLFEVWDSGDSRWQNSHQWSYTYDANGNRTSGLKEDWDTDNNKWVNEVQLNYTYGATGNLSLFRNEKWDGNNWILFDDQYGMTDEYLLSLEDTFGNSYEFPGEVEVNINYKAHEEKIIYDQVVNGAPPVFSTAPTTPQQTLPQYLLNSAEDTVLFEFVGRSTDGKVGLRVFNTALISSGFPPLDLSESVTILDPDSNEIVGNTLFNIGAYNFGKQFDVTKNGIYTIKVAADSNSTFPAPFQIHLAGNVGRPNDNINYDRGTRLDILFNHTAPRPQGIFVPQGLGAQNALFKFGNPAILSPYALAVMVPQLANGFPLNTAIIRAPDPWDPLSITTPTARTPLCGGGDLIGRVIDFTQVPDPAVIPANLDGSICGVIGDHIGSSYTFSSTLILDMGSGQEIVNGEGDDFKIYAPSGNYSVAVSNTPYAGTFLSIGGVVAGTQSFDLASTGLTSARFVLISAAPQVTLDAVKALNVFVDGSVTDPITGTQIWVGDVGYATMTMRRAKAPQLEFDPFLELIAPDGSRFGENESGFADKTSQDLSDAALINIDLVQSGFYRFLGRGYHQNPGNQSSGAFFVRLESGGKYDPQDIVVSDKDEKNTQPQKSGTINQTRQRDSYLFQWHPGQSINIVVNAKDSKLDPVLELYDPEDFLIAANDNFDTRDKNAVLQVNLPANSFNGNETLPDPSTYRIVVSAVDSAGKATPKGEFTVFQRTVSGGNYDLKVFTGSLAPPEPKAPNITNILPNGLIQGANDVELLINGNNFLDGATVSFNQPGIIVRSVTFINSNKLKVKVNILSSTPIGWYNLTVTNPGNLGRTVPQILEIRSNFGTVNLSWDAPTSGENMAPPANLSSQVSGQSSLSKKTRHPQKQVKSLSKNNSNMTTKINRSQVKILASFDIIDEIEPNNNFSTAQVLTGDSMIFVDGWAEITDNGDFIFNYNEGDDDIEDWYKIRTKSPGLDIDLYNFSSDCDLYLFNQPDTSGLVDLSNTIGDTVEEWIYDSELPAGTYFIGVSIFDPAPGGPDTTYYALDIYGDFESGSSSDVVSYNIYRSTHPNARQTGTLIANVDASATTFQDTPPSKQLQYYQVTAVYDQGESDPSNETSVLITKVEEETILPESLTLYQNYPNPFNPSTTIKYSIPQQLNQSNVKLSIFDLSGRKIKTLINQKQNVGTHKISWNGIDDFGNKVTSGMYLYRLQIGTFSEIRKMLLMK